MEISRVLFFTLGLTFLGIGAIGIVLPVLPTTPFIIVSALCFGKSSKRFERWISNNRYFGSYIENYKTKKGVPLDVKIKSIIFLWVMLLVSIFFFISNIYIQILLMVVGVGVTAHIWVLKTMDASV
jgi:uncharacterized membrane protein YbaN (DUF454 family)